MENQQYMQEDEINIREYINVIIKRKKLILAIFLVSVITAAIVSLRMPKIYEITSTIQLGNVSDLLIKNEEVKSIILNQNLLLSVINELNLKNGSESLQVESLQKAIRISDVGGTNLLKIKIIYPSIDTAFKIHDAIVNPLITQGQDMYKQRVSIVADRLKELSSSIKNAEGDISRTQNLIMDIPSSKDIPQAEISLRMIILQNTLPKYENNLTDLRNQRNDLRILLANSKDFKVFDAPIKPKYPVSPMKTQNVLIAGMFSLVFGVFLAFVMEFWQKQRRKN